MSKECTKCGETKDLEEFPYDKTYNKYKSYCKECSRAMCRSYKARNRGKIASYNKMYKAENRDDISVYNHNYNKKNREAIQKRQTQQHRERRENDLNYKISNRLRSKLYRYVKRHGNVRSDYIKTLLGCDWYAFELYFEYMFLLDDNMSWDNHGSYWTIDHVNPCCNFDLTDDENKYICFHWSNIRPIMGISNQKKTGKIILEEIENHEKIVKHFLKTIPPEERKKYTELIEV